nr:cytochrome c oxidase subunit 2 [Exechonella vieirai]
MSLWSQILPQESVTFTMNFLSYFHDYSLSIIMMILMFVAGVSSFMLKNKFISNSPIVTMVEIIWTIIPMSILIFLAMPSLAVLYYMEENSPFTTFKVMGHQWYWSYELMDLDKEFDSYMTTSPTLGEFRLLDTDHRMVVPVWKDVQALVSAADVLHCWTLPSLGIKADAVPGRLNQLNFHILRPCLAYGQCSEICGANHSFMPITAEAITKKKFLKWASNL